MRSDVHLQQKQLYDKKTKTKPSQPHTKKKEQNPPEPDLEDLIQLKKRFPADFTYDCLNFSLSLFPFLWSVASHSTGPTNPQSIKELEQDRAVLQNRLELRGLHLDQSRALCVPPCSHHSSSTLGMLQRDSPVLTPPDGLSFQFSDSRDNFCLIPDEEKEGPSFQAYLVVEEWGSIRHKSHLELLQGLSMAFFKTIRRVSTVLTILH